MLTAVLLELYYPVGTPSFYVSGRVLRYVERVLSKNNSQIGRKKCHYYTGVNYQLRVGQFEPSKYDSSGIILKF